MAQILSVALMNQPGNLARVATELSAAGLNIEAFTGDSQAEMGVARLLVDDPQRGLEVLQAAGHPVQLIEGVKVDMENKPGALAEVLQKLGRAGVNVELVFGSVGGAETGEAVLFTSDTKAAKKALNGE